MLWRTTSLLLSLSLLWITGCSRQTKKAAENPFPVTLGEVIEKDTPIYISTIGNVYSLQTAEIRPQVGGMILKSYVLQGQYVKKGDPLYLIDPRPYKAALDQAKATLMKDQGALEFANIRVRRYAELTKLDYFAKINYEQYLTDAESAKGQVLSDMASIETAELNLEWTEPLAPFDGKISQFNIDPGNLVIANDTNALTTLQQIDPAEIRFTINQKNFIAVQEALKKGTLKLEATLPQKPNEPHEGSLYFIDNHIDTTTGSILLKGLIPNGDEVLWPGEFVRVRLLLRVHPKATLVPQESVQAGQEGSFVYVYNSENSTVEYRKVTAGENIKEFILIEKGVSPGEQVVIKGQVNLRPGVKVKVIPKTASHS